MNLPFRWWEHEPRRLQLDTETLGKTFPGLEWDLSGGGFVRGRLPLWPFERDQPPGVEKVGEGLQVEVQFGHAYPAHEPFVFPMDPLPEFHERSFTEWHILPNGALCLLQDADMWSPRSSLEELLLKAAGWRLEYHLMRDGRIKAMTMTGIVSSDELDGEFD